MGSGREGLDSGTLVMRKTRAEERKRQEFRLAVIWGGGRDVGGAEERGGWRI